MAITPIISLSLVIGSFVNPELNFNIQANEVVISLDIAVPLGLILSEMVSNSSKHAFQNTEEPFIEISLVNEGKDFELIVKDNGIGMPEEFDMEVSGNLGMTIISALIEQIHNGTDLPKAGCGNCPLTEYIPSEK